LIGSGIVRAGFGFTSYQVNAKKLIEGRQKADFPDISSRVLREFFGSTRSRHGKIPNLSRICPEPVPNLSRTIPEQFSKPTRTLPEQNPCFPEQLSNSTRRTSVIYSNRIRFNLVGIYAEKSLIQYTNFSFQLISELKKTLPSYK
jgi:hypothetical protein